MKVVCPSASVVLPVGAVKLIPAVSLSLLVMSTDAVRPAKLLSVLVAVRLRL